MEKVVKIQNPATLYTEIVTEDVAMLYKRAFPGYGQKEGYFIYKEEKPKYHYQVVDSVGKHLYWHDSREGARYSKRMEEEMPCEGDVPPYKIVRYQLVNPTHIR